jgi:hypothetical protein
MRCPAVCSADACQPDAVHISKRTCTKLNEKEKEMKQPAAKYLMFTGAEKGSRVQQEIQPGQTDNVSNLLEMNVV